MNKMILDMPSAEYYADPIEPASLTYSTAKWLCSRSPLHAFTYHPRLGRTKTKPTSAMSDGQIIHTYVLDSDPQSIAIVDADDFKTKLAREARDAALEAGKTPIPAAKVGAYQAKARAIRERIADLGIDLSGHSEATVLWDDRGAFEEAAPVQCRGRLDHLLLDLPSATIFELKSAENAHPEAFCRNIRSNGYDIQAAAYRRAIERIYPETVGRVRFAWLVAELSPPFAVSEIDTDGAILEMGRIRWEYTLGVWRQCLASGHWPGYTERGRPHRGTVSEWDIARAAEETAGHEEEEEAA